MTTLGLKVDLSGFTRGMSQIQKKQLPFARAQALTATAGHVAQAWQGEMRKDLDRPTPFTINSVAVLPARKSNLTSVVYLKDVATQYLLPFVEGGPHFLGAKKGMLTPKDIRTNAYGNLPRNKIAQLLAKPDVFVGPVKLKDGQVINGVWQRGDRGARKAGGHGTKGHNAWKSNRAQGINTRTTLTLLVRFNDPLPVRQRLDFITPSIAAVNAFYPAAFGKAFNRAMATAR